MNYHPTSTGNSPHQVLTVNTIPWVLLGVLLFLTGLVLTWNASTRYKEFESYQYQLIESSVNGTEAQLEIFMQDVSTCTVKTTRN